ncbi:MAG TPA: hypothetical protein VK137_11020, partial [Planctomycetaceae bacterium]|nr:hypothetical protein [Planctomycetaceae bacterium]
GLPQKVAWQPSLFLDEQRAPVLRGPVPKHTKTVMNMKLTNRGVAIALLNGGVIINTQQVMQKTQASSQPSSEVASRRSKETPPSDLNAKRWWWD